MRTTLLCLLIVALGCSKPKAPGATAVRAPIVGGDRDAHGCIGSAGYTYSSLLDKCIRVFETGIRLHPQDKSLDQGMSAFAIVKPDDDKSNAEVFLPTVGSKMLTRVADSGAGTWKDANYVLRQWKGMYILETTSGTVLYQGSSSR